MAMFRCGVELSLALLRLMSIFLCGLCRVACFPALPLPCDCPPALWRIPTCTYVTSHSYDEQGQGELRPLRCFLVHQGSHCLRLDIKSKAEMPLCELIIDRCRKCFRILEVAMWALGR